MKKKKEQKLLLLVYVFAIRELVRVYVYVCIKGHNNDNKRIDKQRLMDMDIQTTQH